MEHKEDIQDNPDDDDFDPGQVQFEIPGFLCSSWLGKAQVFSDMSVIIGRLVLDFYLANSSTT